MTVALLCYDMSMKVYRNTRAIHLPVHTLGYVIDILAILFLITVVIALNRNSHSVSDMFYGLFVYLVPTFLLREWIASKLS